MTETTFGDLPPELQTEIFTYRFPSDVDLSTPALRSSRLVNRQFREITDAEYSRRVCQKPLTPKEMTDYLRTEPIFFGIYLPNVIGYAGIEVPVGTHYFIYLNVGKESVDTSTYESIESDVGYYIQDDNKTAFNYFPCMGLIREETKKPNKYHFDVEDIIEKYINPYLHRSQDLPELDLLSMFRVLSSRLWCNKLNPEYAREYVREQFRKHIVDPEDVDLYDLCICHMYLMGTCRVLNLRVPTYDGVGGQLDENGDAEDSSEDSSEDSKVNFADTWVKDPKYEKILSDLEYLRSVEVPIEERDIEIIKSQIPILTAKIEKAINGFQTD